MQTQVTEFEFGPFRINTSDRILTRHGTVVPLAPKSADTLIVLLSAPNRVIPKAELMRAVWPDSFVEEGSLSRNIYQIRKALGDHPEGHAYIETVPTRGYRFVAQIGGVTERAEASTTRNQKAENSVAAEPVKPPPPPKWSRMPWVPFSFGLAAIVAGLSIGYFVPSIHLANSEPPLLVPFTTFPGGEYEPAFSPDGSQIAFVWSGGREDNYDIYVRPVASGAVRRLTSDPAGEGSPCWSPDGSEIAFVRYSSDADKSGVYVVSAAGGTERKLTSLFRLAHIFDSHLDWSPDGKTLAVVDKESAQAQFSVFLVSFETGQRRKLTNAPAESLGDTGPRFSPDGQTLAFKRTVSPGVNDLYLISLTGAGGPRRVTFDNGYIAAHAWMPTSSELIYSSTTAKPQGLWRLPVSHGSPRPITSLSAEPTNLAISRKGNRLAYSHWFADTNIWRIPLVQDHSDGQGPLELISSTRDERSGQYSPDGTKIAFRSDRSGASEIWMSDAEGNNPVQLTSFGGPLTGTPRWSPDGLQIAFDSRPGGNADIYTIRPASGTVRRITRDQAEDAVPSWSGDGRWIYFASNRTGQWQVWKVSSEERREDAGAVQVTHGGGFAAFESRDGKTLYYAKGRDVDGLWQVPVAGGTETPLIPQLKAGSWGYWAAGDRGIYLIDTVQGRTDVYLYRFQTKSIERLVSLTKQPPFGDSGFSISNDARWMIYTQVDHSGSDIMLVENFH